MKPSDYIAATNTEPFVKIRGMSTGREFLIRRYTYGVLVPDHDHPLSAVSVSNSSLSIDLWTGCTWQCRYCHVQGTHQDLIDVGKMPKKPVKRVKFSLDEILDSLLDHPLFFPHESIISIGTASTEPFAPGDVTESTFAIMKAFVSRNLRNPFWIVTKGGVPKDREKDFRKIASFSKGIMISLCWADNPQNIEPVRNERFQNVELAKRAGCKIAWYLRPLVTEWGANPEHIDHMMAEVSFKCGAAIDMIVPGGLRWTEGIENGVVEIHRQTLPDIPKDDNVKALSVELETKIIEMAERYFPAIPVFFKSSCALSHMLKTASITSVQAFARRECDISACPSMQRRLCSKGKAFKLDREAAQKCLDRLLIPAKAISWSLTDGLQTEPPIEKFTYALRQSLFKELAREEAVI